MQSRERLWATIAIWIPYTIIITSFLLAATIAGSHLHEDTMFGIVLVISAAAALVIRAIWRGLGQAKEAEKATIAEQSGKSKRYDQDRLARLIEQLDQDEVIELETLLLARDES
ncbi:hypothetical protein ACFLYO_02610 [Chloroflexota bacterium]